MAVCEKCKSGHHAHDAYTELSTEVAAGEVKPGDDAGCPFLVRGNECTCNHRNASRLSRHCPTCTCNELR